MKSSQINTINATSSRALGGSGKYIKRERLSNASLAARVSTIVATTLAAVLKKAISFGIAG